MSAASAEDFHIEDAGPPQNLDLAELKPGTIAFSDGAGSAAGAANLIAFADWTRTRPAQKKFLSLFPGYSEPTVTKAASADAPAGPVLEKLNMYVAQARFVLDRPPGCNRPCALCDAAVPGKDRSGDQAQGHRRHRHQPLTDPQGTGNANPDRKWCTGHATLICIDSSYKLEGKIPLGVLLVNKLRDSAKKVVRPYRLPERIVGACGQPMSIRPGCRN